MGEPRYLHDFWDDIKEGSRIQMIPRNDLNGSIAVRHGHGLFWEDDNSIVSSYFSSCRKWKLVEEVEGEMRTEKWVRSDSEHKPFYIQFKREYGPRYLPSTIMNRKNFLRWVGAVPESLKLGWPGNEWCLWFSDEVGYEDTYRKYYDSETGFTKQVFADYAEMRVEK